MTKWVRKHIWAFFVLCSQMAVCQVGTNSDLLEVSKILQAELKKAGMAVPEISFQGKPGTPGIHLDLLSNGQKDKYQLALNPTDEFYVKATSNSLYIAASSVSGLRNGAYWYLQFLGYRYYFPEQSWHYTPSLASVYKPVEKTVVPSYIFRRIWYAYGTDSKQADQDYKLWSNANLLGGEEINSGHSYEAIVNRNKAEFLVHPEFFAQKVARGTIPKNPKFEVSNESLVQLCINDALAQVETYIKRAGKPPVSISMDPSDGGGFSTSAEALKIGGPSEQVFYLANRVAKVMQQKYPSVKVGLYAYNYHSAPPKFAVEPNIIVLIATAYNQSSYTFDQLVDMWKKKGVRIGIRDYLGVLAWDWDMPGQVRGSKTAYVEQIKAFHKDGALYYSGETNIGWISRGLGHYLAAQLLWNVDANVEALKAEFFKNMFGKAAPVMQQLLSSWEQYRQPVPMDGNLLEWYQLVDKASSAEADRDVQNRLKQVKEYLYYTYLFKKWKEASTDENLIALLNFAYRVKDEGVVASYPLFRTLANSAVAGKEHMRFNDPKAKWKADNTVVTKAEIDQKINESKAVLNGEVKAVSTEWPADFKTGTNGRTEINATSKPVKLRGVHKIIFKIGDAANASINLSVGFIKAKNFRPLEMSIYPYNSELSTKESETLLSKTIEPRQPLKNIPLSSLKPGTYIAVINDAAGGFMISFNDAVGYGIVADNESKLWTLNRTNLFFEVKKGEGKIVVQTDGVLTLTSPTGRNINLQGKHPVTNIIDVKEGEEGIWQMKNQSGRIWIQGTLPILSPDEKHLLRIDR
ncbi:MAG: DUF4838 domain-containing protein [Flavisolibacter sp.]